MKEKILKKMQEQRGQTSNVTDQTLEAMAEGQALLITDDEMLSKIDYTSTLASLDGNINHTAKNAVDQAQELATKTAKEKAAAEKKAKKTPKAGEEEITPAMQAVLDRLDNLAEENKQLTGMVNGIEANKLSSQRQEKLEAELKDMPDYFKKPLLDGYKAMTFADDAAFDAYKGSVTTAVTDFSQKAAESGLPMGKPAADTLKVEETGETKTLGAARKVLEEAKEKEKK